MNDQEDHLQRVSDHYDRLAAHGPFATLAPHNKGGRKSEYVAAVFDAALLPKLEHAVPHERILDFGCGTGILTRQLAAYAHEIVGVDVSLGMLGQAAEVCRGAQNVRLLQTDGSNIPLPAASVDWTVAREALCYVPNDDLPSILRDMLRVTKPGGRVLWLDQVSNAPFWQRHPDAPNLIKRSPTSIRAFAIEAGWCVESENVVRSPRFPWIYPAWFGLVPRTWIPRLARQEVAIHKRFPHHPRRWWNALFVLRKPLDE